MKVEPLLYGDRKVYTVASFNRGVADWLRGCRHCGSRAR